MWTKNIGLWNDRKTTLKYLYIPFSLLYLSLLHDEILTSNVSFLEINKLY